jgi:glycyl-tRNA synthetase beta chain
MTTTKSLLVELFVEELPPKSLKKLGESFGITLYSELQKANGLDNGAAITAFASPRRLAAHITNVLPVAAAKPVKVRLMPVSVALDAEGIPTVALIKKLEYLGLEYLLKARKSVWDERISREGEGKNESLFHTDVAAGMPLHESLQFALNQAIAKLPINKVMTYQLADGWSSVNFVRPAHRLVALHGAEIVPVNVLGLNAGRETQGHRFESSVAKVVLKNADSYVQQLETEGAVIASFAARRAEIVKQLAAAAAKEKLKPIEDDALLDEVTALVERPNVLVGKFEKEFLEVPQECLILTMKANQKYFPLLDANGKLTNKFLIVSNIRPADASLVIGGNERVVRPRLADAKFFFDQDRKKPLDSRVLGLAKVVYHNKLGTQGERVQRVQAIARAIGQQLGGDALAAQADQAALLAKADLLTDMVGEFPELQGIMGRYYAQHDGLSDDIAFAIEDHYKPRFAGDELPRNMVGICVALADKLETLVGMFGIGQIPTGDKDPFALRRHALGVIRMTAEQKLPLSLQFLLETAIQNFPQGMLQLEFKEHEFIIVPLWIKIHFFLLERAVGYIRDQGYSAQEADAVVNLANPAEYVLRLEAIRKAQAMFPAEFSALANADKRARNILTKSGGESQVLLSDEKLCKEKAEKDLLAKTRELRGQVDNLTYGGNFEAALLLTVQISHSVTVFFDSVMVNTEEKELRLNRFRLLHEVTGLTNRVADISKLAT